VTRPGEATRWRPLAWIAALWVVVSLFAAGPVSWLVSGLANVAHMPAAGTSRVFVGVVDALVYVVLAFGLFALAGRYRPPVWYVLAALAGYLVGQAGYVALGWLVDGGTAGLGSDPVLITVEAVASMLGAAGAVGIWSVRRGVEADPRD
jgi:hypothetical protein